MQGLWLGTWLRYLTGNRLAPFVPTPTHVGRQMLELARVQPQDYVFDLGCGDGRLLVAAAKQFGAKGHGVELNEELLKEAEAAVKAEGLSHCITLSHQDATTVDLSEASVVVLYLSETGNSRLLPRMRKQLRPGSRVVSFCWAFEESFKPSAIKHVDGIPIFLYNFDGGDEKLE
eukprot:jgi/Mesen1/2973/ME000176S02015